MAMTVIFAILLISLTRVVAAVTGKCAAKEQQIFVDLLAGSTNIPEWQKATFFILNAEDMTILLRKPFAEFSASQSSVMCLPKGKFVASVTHVDDHIPSVQQIGVSICQSTNIRAGKSETLSSFGGKCSINTELLAHGKTQQVNKFLFEVSTMDPIIASAHPSYEHSYKPSLDPAFSSAEPSFMPSEYGMSLEPTPLPAAADQSPKPSSGKPSSQPSGSPSSQPSEKPFSRPTFYPTTFWESLDLDTISTLSFNTETTVDGFPRNYTKPEDVIKFEKTGSLMQGLPVDFIDFIDATFTAMSTSSPSFAPSSRRRLLDSQELFHVSRELKAKTNYTAVVILSTTVPLIGEYATMTPQALYAKIMATVEATDCSATLKLLGAVGTCEVEVLPYTLKTVAPTMKPTVVVTLAKASVDEDGFPVAGIIGIAVGGGALLILLVLLYFFRNKCCTSYAKVDPDDNNKAAA